MQINLFRVHYSGRYAIIFLREDDAFFVAYLPSGKFTEIEACGENSAS